MTTKNIIAVLDQATPEERKAGERWYQDAHRTVASMAKAFDQPLGVVAGIVGVLSPCVRWERNLDNAQTVLQAHANGVDPRSLTLQTFPNNKEKAARILEERTREGIVGGMKVVDFCDQLEDPSRDIPVIDRHAFNVWVGERVVPRNKIPKGRYLSVQEDYRAVGTMRKMGASQVQATTWLTWRRLHS